MRKNIKILICIMVVIIIIPLSCYAEVKPSEKNTLTEIAAYCKKHANLDDISSSILKAWMERMLNEGSISARKQGVIIAGREDDIYSAYEEIEKELKERKIKISSNYVNVKPSEENTLTEIATYCEENENLEKISNPILKAWMERMLNEGSISAREQGVIIAGREDNIYSAYEKIKDEFNSRGIDPEKLYDFKDIGDEKSDLTYWEPSNTGNNKEIEGITERVLGAVQVFGSVASTIVLIVIGIKYMFGSVAEKAKYKETMIPYIIGCILLFGVTTMASILYKVAKQIIIE